MTSVREYAIDYTGGRSSSGASALGGNVALTTGQHDLDGPEHTGQLPADRVSVEDVAGYLAAVDAEAALAELAGKVVGYQAHGAMGATETFSVAIGHHSGTLTADCTFTLSGAVAGISAEILLELLEDSTGGRVIHLPAAVANRTSVEAAQDTTANGTTFLILLTRDGGTTWWGFWAGGASTGPALTVKDEGSSLDTAVTSIDVVGAWATATAVGHAITITVAARALDDLTDVVVTSPTSGDRVRYNGTAFVNSALRWEPHVDYNGSVILDGNGDPVMQEVA